MAGTGKTYVFKPHEQPMLPGSPYSADHPTWRRYAYGVIGVACGLTAGLGQGLFAVSSQYVQGGLGLYSDELAWLTAAYVTANVCANLVLVKARQQFGLQPFTYWALSSYALSTMGHLLVHDFWSALLVRVLSGISASGLTTLCILCMLQAMPAAKRLFGVMIGISIPQFGLPLARVLSPSLLEWGDWRVAYMGELAFALGCLSLLLTLPLPPSERSRAFTVSDVLTPRRDDGAMA